MAQSRAPAAKVRLIRKAGALPNPANAQPEQPEDHAATAVEGAGCVACTGMMAGKEVSCSPHVSWNDISK